MFQSQDMSNRDVGREPETIISASVKVEGDFVSQGNVLIEGEVEGSLKTEKDLHVGEHARISADVVASSATIAGEVQGNIRVEGRLELEPTAKIFGDINTGDLIVASGALINGKLTMGADSGNAPSSSRGSKVSAPKSGKIKSKDEKDELEAEAVADELKELVDEEDAVESKEGNKRTVNAFFTR